MCVDHSSFFPASPIPHMSEANPALEALVVALHEIGAVKVCTTPSVQSFGKPMPDCSSI